MEGIVTPPRDGITALRAALMSCGSDRCANFLSVPHLDQRHHADEKVNVERSHVVLSGIVLVSTAITLPTFIIVASLSRNC
jgi:hypothetical protein